MRFNKLPTTIDEQIALLKERGLQLSADAPARRWLASVGYYRLSAYWLIFEELPERGTTRSKQFRAGVTLEQVIDIYIFDRKLRLLVTEAIERIEISVRAYWSNKMALAQGAHAHMKPAYFKSDWDHAKAVADLKKRVQESGEVFVAHYKQKYSDPEMPPIWIITELMTFREISKWIEATADARIRNAVAHHLGLPTQETLVGTLQHLSYIRNICAHHGRLWNRRSVKRLPNIKRFREDLKMESPGPSGQHHLSNRIYNTLIVLVRLMRHQAADSTYPSRLRELLDTRTEGQLRVMGVPTDWRERPAWTNTSFADSH